MSTLPGGAFAVESLDDRQPDLPINGAEHNPIPQPAVPAGTDGATDYRLPDVPTYRGDAAAYRAELRTWGAAMARLFRSADAQAWYWRRQGRPTQPTPANAHDAARDRWEELQADHYRLLRGNLPEPLAGEDLRRLVATLLSPPHRLLLREVMLDLLSEEITDIALAVAREVACA
jgi:hypothetical protein